MEEKIIEIENNIKHNQYRCPNCNSTEIIFDKKIKKLKCSYCKNVFEEEQVKQDNIYNLEGRNIGKGAKDIKDSDIVTITCNSCGAEVIIDSKSAPYARCHWCHSVLSLDNKIENGAVPDVILPFKVDKEEARKVIEKFLKERKLFSKRKFKRKFDSNNIKGVYLPYFIVDASGKCNFDGDGVHLDEKLAGFNTEFYKIIRKFDIEINGLTIESNSKIIKSNDISKTNQVINAIMPFDTENCIPYKANYLMGYSSEKRNINLTELEEKIDLQIRDICKYSIVDDIEYYNEGIHWDKQEIIYTGKRILMAYFPVWIYTYDEKKFKKNKTHYIVVNGRTKEVKGSVPVNRIKMNLILSLIIMIMFTIYLYIFKYYQPSVEFGTILTLIFFFPLILGIIRILSKYQTNDLRHEYESETKKKISNLEKQDLLIRRKNSLSKPNLCGSNYEKLEGDEQIECKKK